MKLVSGWGESLVELVHGPAARNGLSARGSSALQLASFVLPFLALGPVVRMMDWEIEEDTHRTQMNSEPFVSHFQNAWAQDPHPGNFVLMPSGKIGHSAAEVLGWSWFAQHIIFIECAKLIKVDGVKRCSFWGILDYGLMTRISEDKRVALIQYLMHVCSSEARPSTGRIIHLQHLDAIGSGVTSFGWEALGS